MIILLKEIVVYILEVYNNVHILEFVLNSSVKEGISNAIKLTHALNKSHCMVYTKILTPCQAKFGHQKHDFSMNETWVWYDI